MSAWNWLARGSRSLAALHWSERRAHRLGAPFLHWGPSVNYQLRDGLSFCQIDGHSVFLDIRNDRYFMLPASLERAFSAYLSETSNDIGILAPLIGQKILIATRTSENASEPVLFAPTYSALEHHAVATGSSARDHLEVLVAIVGIKFWLRTKPLESVLHDVCARRERRHLSGRRQFGEAGAEDIIAVTHRFLCARSRIPIHRTCLLDSLALVAFLADRGLSASIVFGVSLSPFSAHCWAQFGDIVLNETVTGATCHTRILVC